MTTESFGLAPTNARTLLAAIDWAAHPLGPRRAWPAALTDQLDNLLASPESSYLVWGESRTFFFNDAYMPILGPRLDHAMGARFEELWADAYPSVEPLFLQALGGQASRVADMFVPMARFGLPEDSWWTFSYAPVFQSGAIAGVLCITNETTATVQQATAEQVARDALAKTESSLSRAQQAGQIGVFSIEIDTGLLTASPEFFKLFGLPFAPSIAATVIEDMVVADDVDIISHAASRASQDIDLHVEYRIRRPSDGELRCIERRAEFETDEAGRPLRMVGVVQDVTERRNDRDALFRLNSTLEATVVDRTEALLLHENIIQSDVTAICAFDTDFRLIAFNKAHNDEFFRVNGFYTKLGDVFWQLFVPEQQDAMRQQMARALSGESFTVEEEFGNPEIDAPRWEIHYSPLRNASGAIIGAFHHARDISARLRAQSELEVAREALLQSQKMEAMGQLTGGVAHDFNNLLTPIIGSLDLLQRRHDFTEREGRLVAGALQSAERAKTLVQRLLAFARRQPLQSGAVDVAALIDGMSELLISTSGPQIAVTTDVPPDLPNALADAHQLEMAILNLCVNARDAMPHGGAFHIAARYDPAEPDLLLLSVRDSGYGMDEETRQRAIEPFFSTKGIGKGTGLGLSMVHGLALQLGGSLEIISEPGRGTQIDLRLPISDMIVATLAAPHIAPSPIGKGRALVVDDEVLVRMMTSEILESLGYETVEVGDAREAERLLHAGERIDLVVTDHLMPGMTGAELAAIIAERWPRLPVLIVSGYSDIEGISPEIPRLQKPFREAELADAVDIATRLKLSDEHPMASTGS